MFPCFGSRCASSVFNMAEDNMFEDTTQPNEGNHSDDKMEEEDDMTNDGKILICHSALRNIFLVC